MSGLTLTQDELGHWLTFTAPDGTSAVMHIESLHLRYPEAVSAPIEKWAAAQPCELRLMHQDIQQLAPV
jgi:hypothetical protein